MEGTSQFGVLLSFILALSSTIDFPDGATGRRARRYLESVAQYKINYTATDLRHFARGSPAVEGSSRALGLHNLWRH
jgi:hypothetical protein